MRKMKFPAFSKTQRLRQDRATGAIQSTVRKCFSDVRREPEAHNAELAGGLRVVVSDPLVDIFGSDQDSSGRRSQTQSKLSMSSSGSPLRGLR